MKKISDQVSSILWGACLLLALTGCTDELDIAATDPSLTGADIDGDCIAFTFSLDKAPGSRSDDFSFVSGNDVTAYENYIDTQDKLRVFFFTDQGDFLFGATDRVVGGVSSSGSTSYWYIRIPMTKIVDREGAEYDVDKIKAYLKANPFKIAILANWPNEGEKVNPADWDDSEGTLSGNDNPASTLKGHPQWNWSNSILNMDIKDSKNIRNINDLHHVFNDGHYSNSNSRFGVYNIFMDDAKPGDNPGYYMGEPTYWVEMRDVVEGWKADYSINPDVASFNNETTANQWIRANWSPNVSLNQEKKIYRHYQHMWFLWNFDAAFKTGMATGNVTYKMKDGSESNNGEDAQKATDNEGDFIVTKVADATHYVNNWDWNDGNAGVTNQFGEEWYKRNGDILYQWMKKSYNQGGTKLAIGPKRISIGEETNDVFFRYISNSSSPAYCVNVDGNYGIHLPVVNQATVNSTSTGLITFQARTSGTLRVKWGSLDGSPSSLAVQYGDGRADAIINRVHSGVTSKTPVNWTNPNDNLQYIDITVEGKSEPMYIYCKSGKAVVYAVEFIRGRYLCDTDREGKAPGPLQPIPMYGVKRFEPIGDWQRGTTITLDGNVSLIRALAKVEVFIKKGFGKPRHVYMRNLNLAARCEPMDVETPTDLIWNDNHSIPQYGQNGEILKDENGNDLYDKPCEWFDIQSYGPSFNAQESHQDWLSWFYGSWNSTNWKTNNDATPYRKDFDLGYYVPNGGHRAWKNDMKKASTNSPHFFNPYNYRSDFCRFLESNATGDSDNDFYHYILYLPEKNIDDPSVTGNLSSTPRVPHIEYRFFPEDVDPETGEVVQNEVSGFEDDRYSNTEYNLDDNQSYRIYFTNYGTSGDQSQNVNYVTPVNLEIMNQNRDTYDMYEKNRENLKYHWPIMRNHTYKFYVGGDGPQNPEIFVEVSDWAHRKVLVQW
ncbi:MAG: hypothetical protein J1D77_04110 [Muribaculaceae bacterium]|nr:hypothetical protein [Muribaculaceae bacterium]